MFTPHSLGTALLMMITSAICWGSWANTYKGVKNYRFELFYWDYAVGIFLISLIFGHTMGSTGHDASSLVSNIHAASTNDVMLAMVGAPSSIWRTYCWSRPSIWRVWRSRFQFRLESRSWSASSRAMYSSRKATQDC